MSWFSRMFFRAAKTPPPPNVTARVGRDDSSSLADAMRGYVGDLNFLSAKYPFEWIELIDQIYRYDPNCKKHLLTTISLGNPGHELEIDAPTEQRAQQAIEICNGWAARCFPFAGGYDGATNGLFAQAARNGAVCAEFAALGKTATELSRIYLVPIRTLRFRRRQDGELELGQLQDGRFVPLNMMQTSYHAIWFEDSNPYPIPPALAALHRLSSHKRIMQSIEHWFSKLAAMGFLSLNFQRPNNQGESDEAYQAKCATNLQKLTDVVKANLTSGIVVGYDDMEAKFQNTSAGAGGAKQVAQMIDEDLFAGLGRDPVLFGRSFSRTETWASVAYEELTSEIKNIQRAVKRTLEHGHRLNLALNGFGDCGVSLKFNALRSLDAFRDAEAKMMIENGFRSDYTSGICDIEEARDKLGYNDQGANSGAYIASFKAEAGRYILERRPRLFNGWAPQRIDAMAMVTDNVARREIQDAARKYLAQIRAMLRDAGVAGVDAVYEWAMARDIPFIDEFVAEALRIFYTNAQGSIDETRLVEIAKEHLGTVWTAAKADPDLWGSYSPRYAGIWGEFDMPDRRALNYMTEKVEKMYISKYVENSPVRSRQIQSWLTNQYIEKGLGIGKQPKQLAKFKEEFGVVSEKLGDHAARIIIDTGVQRARNWSYISALSEEGFKRFRIAGPVDNIICRYCSAMVGRTFEVATEKQRIDQIISSGEEDISRFSPFLTSRYGTKAGLQALKDSSNEQIQEGGMVTPPFHPLCRHRMVVEFG